MIHFHRYKNQVKIQYKKAHQSCLFFVGLAKNGKRERESERAPGLRGVLDVSTCRIAQSLQYKI